MQLPYSGDGSAPASKKRKRKRNNKTKTKSDADAHLSQEHAVANENNFQIHSSNKKFKFDTEEKEDVINQKNNDSVEKGNFEHHEEEDEGEEIIEDAPEKEEQVEERIEDEEEDEDDEEENKIKTKNPRKNKDKKKHKKDVEVGSSKSSSTKNVTFYNSDGDDDDEEEDYYSSNRFYEISESTRAQLAKKAEQLLEFRKELPVYQHKDEVIDYVTNNQVTVVIGETGSGKSTQIPQFLMPLNSKLIAVTQPRRVAAASLAARVSEEYGCQLGQEVGYQVRFSNITHPQKTKLKYLTDGMLLRELMIDSKLSKYSTIILDEAHERTVLTDLIMGFLKQLIVTKTRRDLKIIVMSATLNAELFSKFFGNAPILFIEGKMFPVSPFYLSDSSEDIVDTMVRSVIQINLAEQEGDILCFLPGQEEIDSCVTVLTQVAPLLPKQAPLLVPMALYAALSPAKQAKIFEKLASCKKEKSYSRYQYCRNFHHCQWCQIRYRLRIEKS